MQKILLSALLISGYLWANTTVPSTGSDLKITIYNDNRAFINDKRKVEIKQGKQKLVYEGIPSLVIAPSVVPTFTGVKTKLYSQNYMYDLISLNSMLKHSIGKNVAFYTNEKEPRLSEGTLLCVSPTMVQELGSQNVYTLISSTQVIFSKIPENMITKPSLVWNIETQNAGYLNIDLKYLTTGISWKSDYVLNLEKDTLSLTGWITVNNNSGVSYKNAQITCLAGDVNRVQEPHPQRMYKNKSMMVSEVSEMDSVLEESFSGYHIYKIPFKETINNKQQKQIGFIDKKEISYTQYGVHTNNYFERYGEQKLVFKNTIEFKNTKENNLGLSLPKGVVRMYQKDDTNETHFIGEHKVGNIPEDENVTLTIGTLFDAVGEKTITKYEARKHYRNVETTYHVRNQGKVPLVLKITEHIPTYGDKIQMKTSCKDLCSVKKKTAFIQEFTVKLKPKEKYVFTSEFEVNF